MSAHVMLTTRLKAYKEKERIQQNVERKINKDRKKESKKKRKSPLQGQFYKRKKFFL